jgi:hypothetical protein
MGKVGMGGQVSVQKDACLGFGFRYSLLPHAEINQGNRNHGGD